MGHFFKERVIKLKIIDQFRDSMLKSIFPTCSYSSHVIDLDSVNSFMLNPPRDYNTASMQIQIQDSKNYNLINFKAQT